MYQAAVGKLPDRAPPARMKKVMINKIERAAGAIILGWLHASLIGGVVLGASSVLMAPATAAARPNIVVIMTDDQRLDDLRVMTKTKALIGSGTTFSNFFVSLPVCCPSRATYLTGQYPHNHGVLTNRAPQGGYTRLNHNNTLPLWLQESGYYTSYVGKYLNGYPTAGSETEVPPGWNNWQGLFTPTACITTE
jgi:N-acetylglucosamine-6-sulfatase